jgi:hypothetical protein
MYCRAIVRTAQDIHVMDRRASISRQPGYRRVGRRSRLMTQQPVASNRLFLHQFSQPFGPQAPNMLRV